LKNKRQTANRNLLFSFCSFLFVSLEVDAKLIRARWGKRSLISLALADKAGSHEMEDCQPGAFCDDTHYPVSLFDLVLNLYPILFTHAGFAPLRQALHEQWEDTAARIETSDQLSVISCTSSGKTRQQE